MTREQHAGIRARIWRNLPALLPGVVLWIGLAGWLAYELFSRSDSSRDADEANLREWINESRIDSETAGGLARDYLRLLAAGDEGSAASDQRTDKRAELETFLFALCVPTREHQLPLFPKIYRMEVRFVGEAEPVAWESFVPREKPSEDGPVHELVFDAARHGDLRAELHCEYELHAFSRHQQDLETRRRNTLLGAGLFTFAAVFAGFWLYSGWRREWKRELRLAEAERSAAESRSQMFAGIGITAGSYAHNIKNLLVRPNDLLDRLLQADGLNLDQQGRVKEIRETLGTVTERLQQILRTVRRDPADTRMDRVDLNEMLAELSHAWSDMSEEKWKMRLVTEPSAEPVWVDADVSHLQQALENLLFNARDAVFEMRKSIRDRAYEQGDPEARRKAIREAAGWRGTVTVRAYRDEKRAVLEVRDDGIGMTPEVREKCLSPHFSTKKGDALFAGLNTGSGLGLSFVTTVLDHHGARLEIDSERLKGTTFRVRFGRSANTHGR